MSDERKREIDVALASASDLVVHALDGVEKALDMGGVDAARAMIRELRALHADKPWNRVAP